MTDSPQGVCLVGMSSRVCAGEGRTTVIVGSSRNFATWNPLLWPVDELNRYIAWQDQAVVESSDPPEVPEASEERSMATDAPRSRWGQK